ncbi:MAG TPA: 50S ribosomal protein L25 [Candidatus Omnitrophica bacterium]|nr:50S ribosomal protein L25 [Candidatus Omnitrophota bacterium]
MKEVVLSANLREEIGSRQLKKLRREGFIPGIVYGGSKAFPIKITRSSFIKFLHEHKGENVIINLEVAEEKSKSKDNTVMIKEMQHDPVSEEIIHLDFNKISLTQAISVKVPVEAKGEAEGVKADGGSLNHILWELELECLPKDMPKSILVDVSALKIGDAIHVKDIKFSQGVTVKHEADAIVLSVAPPAKEEVEEEEALGEEGAEPEVIKEKKEGEASEAKEQKEVKPKESKPQEKKEEKS